MVNKKNMTFAASLGVMAVYLIAQTQMIVNPALSSLSAEYPEIPYSLILMISTLPSLILIPVSLISGSIAGKKVKFKTLCVVSAVIMLLSGLMPLIFKNFYVVLASRALFGLGNGLSMPLCNALVLRLFSKEKSAGMLGVGTIVQNLTGVLLLNISGIVCAINVDYTWLVHLFLAIPLALILFFMPEPEKEEYIEESKPRKKTKLPIAVYIMSLAYGLLFAVYYPFLLNLSAIVVGEGIGGIAIVGTISSMYTIGGIISGLIFSSVFKIFGKKHTIPFMLALHILGLALGYFGTSIIALMATGVITGITIFSIWAAAMMDFDDFVPSESIASASGIWVAFLNVGSFAASLYAGAVATISGNTSPRLPIFVGIFISAAVSAIWVICKYKNKKTPETI